MHIALTIGARISTDIPETVKYKKVNKRKQDVKYFSKKMYSLPCLKARAGTYITKGK